MAKSSARPWVVLSSSLVALLLAEIALEARRPLKPELRRHPVVNQYVRREHPRNIEFPTEVEEGLPGMEGGAAFRTNGFGFRGPALLVPKPTDEYRVFLVGGSTTECLYLGEEEAFPAVVAAALREQRVGGREIRVQNAGVSSAATDDHVAMIGQRIVHLEPDLVVVFAGINDLTLSIYGVDPLHYTTPDATPRPLWLRLAKKSRIARILRRRFVTWASTEREVQERLGARTSLRRKVALQRSHPPLDDALPPTDPVTYRNNLLSIIGMAHAHGFQLVFITQQTTWRDPRAAAWHWMRYRNERTFTAEAMADALETLNDVMRHLAREHSVPLFDLPLHVRGTLEHFYDDCHFNTRGARLAGERFADFLVREVLLVDPVHAGAR